MAGKGMSDTIGMLIDTSRNGWGGSSRPTKASTSTDVDKFVNESRIDRRTNAGAWCNQSGAGLGERPRAVDADGIQAYVWIKPPGESDGASPTADGSKGIETACDPSALLFGTYATGALPNAPISERWFPAAFQELMANAYPPLEPVTSSDTVPPSAPSNLKASNLTTMSVTLSWSASTDNVGVVAYDVYSGTTLVTSVQWTMATVQDLVSGTTYTFTVRSRDAAGNLSAASQPITVMNGCCGTPNQPSVPTNVAYSKVTYTSLTLSWTASTDEIGIEWYEVFDVGVMIGSSKSTQYDVTGLLPGTSHTFTVRAVSTRSMNSDASSPVTVRTLSITVPSAPANVRWTASGGTVLLCWDAPADWNDGYGYHLLYGSLDLGLFTDTCVALIGFNPGTPYTFTVKTVDAAGNPSVASSSVTVLLEIPKDTTPPTAPSNLTWSLLSSTSARLTWTASKDDVGVVLYQIYSSGALFQTVPSATSATVTGLTIGQTYAFTVKGVDAAGNASAESNVTTVTIPTF
jgi:chitodextrinase